MNEIYLRRKAKVHVRQVSVKPPAQLATIQKEVGKLGYVLSERLMERIETFDSPALGNFLRTLIHELKQLTGAHRQHMPLYPGFPDQVLQLSEAELYLNAIAHYLTLKRLVVAEDARPPLLDGEAPQLIDLGTRQEFESLFTTLAAAASSLSQQDKDDMAWYVRQYRRDVLRLLPVKFSFKENLALVGGLLIQHLPFEDVPQEWLHTHFQTATDVLRLAVALSGGDLSLAEPCKFRSFKRAERRLMLALLEREDPTEDMLRWAERWKRLGERLHPSEMAHRFPRAQEAFQVLRTKRPFKTFNAKVEQALDQGDPVIAADLLEVRPGEFARKLDVLLRSSKADETLVQRFASIANKVSTPVLLQVLAHFQHRAAPTPLRTYFPKGEVAKVFASFDHRASVPEHLASGVVTACEVALVERFSKLPSLGLCFIDPALRKCTVPMSQRSASKSLRTLGRGSRLPLPEGAVIRLFLWWMNGNGRTDIDLSAVLYGTQYEYLDTLAYYNLKQYGAHHSGDIVDAPKGAAEFIDLDIERLRERGVRFVVMVINSFTAQSFCDLPECFAGWMLRHRPSSGEVFEPLTVVDKVDVASNTRICLPLIYDLAEQEVLWADIAIREQPRWNNVRNNLTGVSLMLRAISGMVKPDLYTLFRLHAQARGTVVDSPQDADTIFSMHNGVTPFSTDDIRSLFL